MKAANYPGDGEPLEIINKPDPSPKPDEVVIEVHRCGICGTDLHMTEGHDWQFPADCTPGHEYAGRVVAKGSQVRHLSEGDLITALPSTGCGNCDACATGNLALCHNAPGLMGGFAQYISVPETVTTKLPSTLTAADGALIEPFAVGLYGLQQANIKAGAKVLVLGAGSVALCAIFWAKQLGASVVAMSRSSRRKELAMAMGADALINFGYQEQEQIQKSLGGAPDIVVECIGHPGFINQGISMVKPMGKVVSLGFCTAPDQFTPAMAGFKGVALFFPVGYTLANFQHCVDVLSSTDFDPKIIITNTVGLDQLPSMMKKLRGGNQETKVHINPMI
jgi:threonine dehydrogenase-like Zn-dependent dehydrogenase